MLKERLFLLVAGSGFPKNHKLFEIFDKKLQQMHEAGLIEFLNRIVKTFAESGQYRKYQEDPNEKKVLTLKSLEAGFVIWLTSLSLSIVMFICEWIIRMRDLVVFKNVFEAFTREQTKCSQIARRPRQLHLIELILLN